jgi:hypothetical protein
MADITIGTACLHCFGSALLYVGSLFVLVPNHIRALPRDHPLHVQYRIFAASTATILVIVACFWVFPTRPNVSFLESLGVRWDSFVSSVLTTIVLLSVFYLGPLVTEASFLVMKRYYEIKYNGLLSQRVSPASIFTIVMEFMQQE